MDKFEALEILEKDLEKYFDFKKKNVGDGVRLVNIMDEYYENRIKGGE